MPHHPPTSVLPNHPHLSHPDLARSLHHTFGSWFAALTTSTGPRNPSFPCHHPRRSGQPWSSSLSLLCRLCSPPSQRPSPTLRSVRLPARPPELLRLRRPPLLAPLRPSLARFLLPSRRSWLASLPVLVTPPRPPPFSLPTLPVPRTLRSQALPVFPTSTRFFLPTSPPST